MEVKEIVKKMTMEEKAGFLSGKDFWHTEDVERLGVPSFMMCDGPNGLRKQNDKGDHLGINDSIQTICYPASCAVASSFDLDMAEELGEHLGAECQREQISMLLGPGMNIKRSPLCGRNFEYYSEDPFLIGCIASGYVKGLQSKKVLACPKHFAANNQETRRMAGSSNVDERTFYEIYLSAFEQVVKKSRPKGIMCAYNKINGTYCSENRELLTDILREKWGFDGFVVTDWGAGKDAAKGVSAGVNLVMPGGSEYHKKEILKAYDEGRLTEEEIDKAVGEILSSFFQSSQTDANPASNLEEKQDYEFAQRLAEQSAILLKNEEQVLPLKDEKVAFIGAFAKTPRYQGSGSSHVNSRYVSNAWDVAQKMGKNVTYAQGYDLKDETRDDALLAEALEAAKTADKVVVFAGLPDRYESEGFDRKNLNMPENQNRLISALADENENIIVVMHNGSPVVMPWLHRVKAVLEMYLAGDAVGDATVALLYGAANPSGKLAETFPECIEHTPAYLNFPGKDGNPEYREGVFVGYRYYDTTKTKVLFPFGHGLSYTTFSYSDIKLSADSIKDTEKVTVSLKVTNTGAVAGREVVQLYVRDVESAVMKPDKELKGFSKVLLQPGEAKEVSFELDYRSFAYYETKIHDFYVESGDFEILVGTSSTDILLSTKVYVEGTMELPVVFDMNSTVGEILATKKGRKVIEPILQRLQNYNSEQNLEALGEDTQEMEQAMALETPLSAMNCMGGIPMEEVEEILKELNR